MAVNPVSSDAQVDEILKSVNAGDAVPENAPATSMQAMTGDLLDIGGPAAPKNVLEEVKDLTDILGGSTSNIGIG